MASLVGEMQIVLSANAVSYSQSLDQAAAKLDQLRGKAEKVGHSTVSSVQAASGALRELNGDFTNNIRAVERFITTIPGVGDALKMAFPLVGVAAFGAMLISTGTKVYEFQKTLSKMPDSIRQGFDKLNEETEKAGVNLDITNDKLAISIAKLEHKPINSLKLALDEDRLAAADLASEIDHATEEVGKLLAKNSTSGFSKQLGEFVFGGNQVSTAGAEEKIKGIMARLQKAQDDAVDSEDNAAPGTDAAAVKLANRAKLQGALTAAITETKNALADEHKAQAQADNERQYDVQAGGTGSVPLHDAVINDYQGFLRQLNAQQHNFQAGNTHSDLEAQQAKDEMAKQQAADAKRAQEDAKRAASAAASAAMRNLENMRLQQEQAGKLGAQADLDFWSAKSKAFSTGSEQYLQIQKKITEDQKSLARYNEQYNSEAERGSEIRAKNTEALEKAGIELDLASGKITKLEADTRIAAAQTAEYTAKLKSLHDQLAAINADKTITPEERRNRAGNIQNQIDDAQGQQAAAEAEGRVKATQAVNAHEKAVRADNDALAQLDEINARNIDLMNQMVTAHDMATGAISKHEAAMRTAATHASEYASQLAEIARQQAAIDADKGMSADERKTKTQDLSNKTAEVQGEAARTALADNWAAQQETAVGGFLSAVQEMTAAGKDYAAITKSITTEMVDGVNKTLVDLLTTRHHPGDHVWRALGHDLATRGTSTALQVGEGQLFGGLQSLFGGHNASVGSHASNIAASIFGGATAMSDTAVGIVVDNGMLTPMVGIPEFVTL